MSGDLCAVCVDNFATFITDAATRGGYQTGPVAMCWPCADQRAPALWRDMCRVAEVCGGPVELGEIVSYTVTRVGNNDVPDTSDATPEMIGGTPNTTITAHAFMTSKDRERLRGWLKEAELDGLRIREMTFNEDGTLTIRFVARRDDGKVAVLHNYAKRTAVVIEGVATIPQPAVPFPPISYREV